MAVDKAMAEFRAFWHQGNRPFRLISECNCGRTAIYRATGRERGPIARLAAEPPSSISTGILELGTLVSRTLREHGLAASNRKRTATFPARGVRGAGMAVVPRRNLVGAR